jgi:transposase-like protein
VIERLHEEFRRRAKAQASLPSEDAALILLFARAEWADQVAQDRRLAEDCRGA